MQLTPDPTAIWVSKGVREEEPLSNTPCHSRGESSGDTESKQEQGEEKIMILPAVFISSLQGQFLSFKFLSWNRDAGF